MSQRERDADAPAPGNWRVIAQPYSAVPAPAPGPAGSEAISDPGAEPPRRAGRPLLATSICAGLLLLSLAGRDETPMTAEGTGELIGYVFGGAVFGMILWGIAFAITIRKASTRWKAGSLIALAVLGGLVALSRVGIAGAPPQVPVVRKGK